MEFFGMGPLEILLILIVGLIAFGPGRLPKIARNLGKGISAFKKATTELTAEVSKEFEMMEKEEKEASKQEKLEKSTHETGTAEEDEASNTSK